MTTTSAVRYQAVSRARMDRGVIRFRLLAQAVADAAHGVDQTGAVAGVQLLAERLDERVEGVALDITVGAPEPLDQRLPRHDAAGVSHQAFEQVEFRAGQGHDRAAARDDVTGRVERQVGDLEADSLHRRPRRPSARSRASSTLKANGLAR